MWSYHNTNITVKTIGGEFYLLNDKIEIPTVKFDNYTQAIMMNLSTKKEFLFLDYQCDIWTWIQTYNR